MDRQIIVPNHIATELNKNPFIIRGIAIILDDAFCVNYICIIWGLDAIAGCVAIGVKQKQIRCLATIRIIGIKMVSVSPFDLYVCSTKRRCRCNLVSPFSVYFILAFAFIHTDVASAYDCTLWSSLAAFVRSVNLQQKKIISHGNKDQD